MGIAIFGSLVAISPLYTLAFVFGSGLLILAIWKPKWLVFGLASYTVFEQTALRWLPSQARYVDEVAILLLLFVIIFKQILLNGKLRYRRTPLELPNYLCVDRSDLCLV